MVKNTFSKWFNLTTKEEAEQLKVIHDEVKELLVDQIIPNRYQPRTYFDDRKIHDLAQTIRTHGIIQPIVVRTIENNRYEIIAGERRFRAVCLLGWDRIPAIIREFTDRETASVALIENIQREELSPIEEAFAYEKLLQIHELTQEALAQRLGKSQSTVANKLRLLKLPNDVQQALMGKIITERHARALLSLPEEQLQIQVLKEIIEQSLNVKQTEFIVQKLLEPKQKKRKATVRIVGKDNRLAINTIRESVSLVSNTGLSIHSEEEEFDDYIQFTIKIPKK